MLNEMLIGRFVCPVCGRIIYFPTRGYWCPYCGIDLNHQPPIEDTNSSERLTARTETGIPYYIGKHTFREKTFAQDMGISAIAEVLEKLAELEDEQENN